MVEIHTQLTYNALCYIYYDLHNNEVNFKVSYNHNLLVFANIFKLLERGMVLFLYFEIATI